MSQFVSNIQKKSSKIDASNNKFAAEKEFINILKKCGFKNPSILLMKLEKSIRYNNRYKTYFQYENKDELEAQKALSKLNYYYQDDVYATNCELLKTPYKQAFCYFYYKGFNS